MTWFGTQKKKMDSRYTYFVIKYEMFKLEPSTKCTTLPTIQPSSGLFLWILVLCFWVHYVNQSLCFPK